MDEAERKRPDWSWVIVLAICAALVGWGLVNYCLVQDRPRQWDFGALPDTPSESPYSTSEPVTTPETPRQIAPLPEVRPMERERANP
jgi:hypothetical protein